MDELKTNVLYFGDNLEILHKYIPDNSIDLIYLDPPFSSKKDYNIISGEVTGERSESQIKAFSGTWTWDQNVERTYYDILQAAPPQVATLIDALHSGLGSNDVTAYLVMMTSRLVELRRVLKDAGSLYLHYDPTAGHYLKLILDLIFGPTNFICDIICRYGTDGAGRRQFGGKQDTIFLYAKSSNYFFNPQEEKSYFEPKCGFSNIITEKDDKCYYNRASMRDAWDIPGWRGNQPEMLSYPTQKPLALLERIIKASSHEGDVILDPFCGCGTALVAAQKLNRHWIGIDITYLAIRVMNKRFKDTFPGIEFEVVGEPLDLAGAKALANQDRYQFQWWALSLIEAQPLGEKKKGADEGIDGVIIFTDERPTRAKRVVVQVKSGHVHVKDIRELKDIASRNAIGIFVTLEPPTEEIQNEAVSAGYYHSPLWERDYPKIQILTIEELLDGKTVDMPPVIPSFPKV
jgi:site-specific DNA-methyltransferase (adenine-specific)